MKALYTADVDELTVLVEAHHCNEAILTKCRVEETAVISTLTTPAAIGAISHVSFAPGGVAVLACATGETCDTVRALLLEKTRTNRLGPVVFTVFVGLLLFGIILRDAGRVLMFSSWGVDSLRLGFRLGFHRFGFRCGFLRLGIRGGVLWDCFRAGFSRWFLVVWRRRIFTREDFYPCR